MELFQDGQYGKMSQGHLIPTEGLTLGRSWIRWQKQGRWTLNGNCWTQNILESPKSEGEYLLCLDSLLIPENQVPAKFFLSIKALLGIYKREIQLRSIDRTEFKTVLELESAHLLRQTHLSVLLAKHLPLDH